MTTPTLLPANVFPGTGTLLALDIDGVLNTIDVEQWERNSTGSASFIEAIPPLADGMVRRQVRTEHRATYWVDFNPAAISALNDFVRTFDVELGWLTTWGPNARAFVEQALDGALSGGFVLAKRPKPTRGVSPAEWKRASLRARLDATGQPWIWADDEEINIANLDQGFQDEPMRQLPHLLFSPAPTVGLTLDDVDAMRRFATTH